MGMNKILNIIPLVFVVSFIYSGNLNCMYIERESFKPYTIEEVRRIILLGIASDRTEILKTKEAKDRRIRAEAKRLEGESIFVANIFSELENAFSEIKDANELILIIMKLLFKRYKNDKTFLFLIASLDSLNVKIGKKPEFVDAVFYSIRDIVPDIADEYISKLKEIINDSVNEKKHIGELFEIVRRNCLSFLKL